MTEYYFVGSSLPELQVGYPPDISSEEFVTLCRENLTDFDQEKARIFRRIYDLENILAFWKKEELDFRGNFDENELEDALLTRDGLPEYIVDFLEKYESTEDKIKNYSALVASFFKNEIEQSSGFLRELIQFERDWRLVFAGFRAKEMGRDLATELQYEDPDDELVAQILAQKDAKHYEPPVRFADLKGLFEEHKEHPLELHQALCEYRFQKISELYGLDAFSMDRLLGYFVQLTIVEKWLELDKKKGIAIVDTIVKEAS